MLAFPFLSYEHGELEVLKLVALHVYVSYSSTACYAQAARCNFLFQWHYYGL